MIFFLVFNISEDVIWPFLAMTDKCPKFLDIEPSKHLGDGSTLVKFLYSRAFSKLVVIVLGGDFCICTIHRPFK